MSSPFAVTAATNSVLLDGNRKGETTFTVSNASGRALRGRAIIVPAAPAQMGWFTVAGQVERAFAIAGVEQYAVQVAAPAGVAPGSYAFHLDMVGEVPDEEYTTGPTVTFTVIAPPPPRKFPWWIAAVIAAVVIVAIVGFMMARSNQANQAASATATVAAAMTRTAMEATATAQAQATAVAQAQAAAAQATANAQATASAQATATAVVQATETAVANAMGKYVGVWDAQESDAVYLTKLQITREGANLKLSTTGKAFVVSNNGAMASQPCSAVPGGSECTWGAGTVAYQGDPVVFEFETQPGLKHRVTLSLTPDGATLTALYQTFFNNALKGTLTTAFKRHRGRFDPILVNPILLDPSRIQPRVFFTPSP